MGWVESKKYLYGSLMITPDSIENVDTNLIKNRISIEESTTDIYSEIEYIINNLCDDRFITQTMLSFYLLSLLKPKIINFSGTCPSFALAIIGKSGTGKTSTVMPLMNPLNLKTCCFEDSQASIRRIFQENSCGCTIIDDFKCNSTNNNNKFEEIIRLAGDLTSNGRRVINQKTEDITVTGMAVFTGETIPKIQASSFPRLLLLEIEADSINFDTLSILIKKINYYILFICKFIQYIMENNNFYNEYMEKFQEERQSCRQKYKEYALHPRYYDIYSWLIVTYRYINNFCDNRLINSYNNYENELITRIVKQNSRFDPEPIKIFIKIFNTLKDMNEFIIKGYECIKNGDDFDVCCTDDYFILKSGTVYKKIVDYCSANKIDFPYSERKLRYELHSKGILEKRGTYHTYEIKTKHGNGIRVYNIKKKYNEKEMIDLLIYLKNRNLTDNCINIILNLFKDKYINPKYMEILCELLLNKFPYEKWDEYEYSICVIIKNDSYLFSQELLCQLADTLEILYAKATVISITLLSVLYDNISVKAALFDMPDIANVRIKAAKIAYKCNTYTLSNCLEQLKELKTKVEQSGNKNLKEIINYYKALCYKTNIKLAPIMTHKYITKSAAKNFNLAKLYLENWQFHSETAKTS